MPIFASVKTRFDVCPVQRDCQSVLFDADMSDRNAPFSCRFDVAGRFYDGLYIRFDAETHGGQTAFALRYDATPLYREFVPNRFDALRERFEQKYGVPARFDVPESARTGMAARFDSLRWITQKCVNRFDASIPVTRTGGCMRFDAQGLLLKRVPGRFQAIPQEWKALVPNRFDALETVLSGIPLHRQAFVKPGWRILLRNVDTNERRDLGFMEQDTLDRSITDVELPDGDYEITILTSSLFWRDTVDRAVRNVMIRSGEEPVIGLPAVLNLTSEVADGVTTLAWASEIADFEDCAFGLWFAEFPPVVVFREPDQIVEYTASAAEYQLKIRQNTPLWCVVMATKGNLRGPASEIFLDWGNGLPRRPDDQMAFDVFIDEKLEALKNATGPSGVGRDTSQGYW